MPRSNSSAEHEKAFSDAPRLPSSPGPTPPIVQTRQPEHPLIERGIDASSASQGNVPSTVMSELPKATGDGKQPLQDPRILAVSRSSPSAGGGGGRPPGGPAIQGRDRSASLGKDSSRHENDGWKPSVSRYKVDSASQLNQYREQLARDMQRQGLGARPGQSPDQPSRVSPILEEAFLPNSPSPMSPPSTTSTNDSVESNQTIRGGVTPGFVAKTPSYPFPRVGTSGNLPTTIHKPFTTLSPTGTASNMPPSSAATTTTFGATRPQDQILSNPSTPASAMSFQPPGAPHQEDHPDFPTPDLYELSLMLSSEPGLDAWWRSVVHIMTVCYKAERLTLSVPADSTDLENVPWGQKAAYNARQEDSLSMEYMARGSSVVPSSTGDVSELASPVVDMPVRPQPSLRPQLQTRHSFTAYEDEKNRGVLPTKLSPLLKRPGLLARSKSTYPGTPGPDRSRWETPSVGLNKQALADHDAEVPDFSGEWEAPTPQKENHGRVFELLQALDYEADPLIDHHGVTRVLDRGRVIALTRSYPYLEEMVLDKPEAAPVESKPLARSHSPEDFKSKGKRFRNESSTKLSNILSSAHPLRTHPYDRRPGQNIDKMISEGEPRRPPTPKYEEYEQMPPSPWSQSPAPSPAIRADPKENPFFTDAVVDEASFNPTQKTPDYSAIGPQEAIGVDNAWTVLHVPLTHPLLSRPSGFKLDTTLMDQKSSRRGKDYASDGEKQYDSDTVRKDKPTPIAILSILSTTIPYPSNLRHSLEHLSPHLATSFSLCRHYSNLESELSRMHHRRPRMTGFGAVDPDGRPLTDPAILDYAASEDATNQSHAGSLTSPSEYSTRSRSIAGTPGGTPGWETSSLGGMMDKRPAVPSPAPVGGDSYFTTRARSSSKTDLAPAAPQRVRRNSKGSTASEKRSSLRLSGGLSLESGRWSPDIHEPDMAEDVAGKTSEDLPVFTFPKRGPSKDVPSERKDERTAEWKGVSRALSQTISRQTKLHSYGGDFATTFQSLPPGSTFPTRGTLSRSDSLPTKSPEMALPTDKLKDLILDSLPAQLFVALPGAGGIVWVNSRYLAYRGQSLAELHADAHASIHPDDRDTYLKAWGRAVKTGTDFHMNVRIRRFDGAFRCFSARVVACRNKRNEIVHHLGSYTDIHEQTMAELKLVRQQEIEASEAKYRFLANLIPQIIFTATEDEGITFANEQWLAYTGQNEEDAMGLGFMDYVHPDDLAKCRIPSGHNARTPTLGRAKAGKKGQAESPSTGHAETNIRGVHYPLSRQNSSSSDSVYELTSANLTELAKAGIVKVGTDSNGRLSYATEIRLRAKNGDYRWHLIRCVEIDNIGKNSSSYFGSATDINDHKLLEVKLKEAMESKSRFLSNMSHEIRTPLIGISGMVSFLQDTTLNEEQRDYTNTIQTSANSLLMIINDILDLSKVDAGMMKLSYEWFHTRSLIEDVNELVSAMAIARRLELNYLVDEDVPTWIKGDRVRLRQVLLNVIGNAIKFTETGEVFSRCRVKAGAEGLGEHQTMLEFAVTDTGRGFTEEEAKLIFKPFSQIDGSSTRAHGGSGLGLVISRQLVELHGGKMEGTAEPGKGATFTFTAKFSLPTEEDHPDAPVNPVAPQTPAVVEDIPTQPFRQFTITKHRGSPVVSPSHAEQEPSSAVPSSGSSNPSTTSTGTRVTGRSSISSVNAGLARFSEAARASGQDLSQMRLEMPSGRISPGLTPSPDYPDKTNDSGDFRPPMFSILVICPQKYSREATVKHIEMTLPKDVPHQITALASAQEAEQLIGREDPVIFTHILINLPSPHEITKLMDEINHTKLLSKTTVILLTDSIQRQALSKLVEGTELAELLSDNKITYVYKPVKPSRLAVIFDPAKERDMSVDRSRSTAQQIVETQRRSYQEVEKRMGNKGYKVLLVEDNPVNQKVLKKYLVKVGLEVDLAMDGEECTDKVFSHPHGFYSLILCDLHMPRKDGYHACREVREWETKNNYEKLPIIALSANVMSDVQEKCVEAGFSDYVTKPVDFIDLSTALSKYF